jgi:hypothetical protein
VSTLRILSFCSFSPLPLVGVVGFAWQRPFWLAKGKGVTSILRGIPLRFLQSKNSRVVFTLLMLVYSVIQVFMWRFSSVAAEEIEDRFWEFASVMGKGLPLHQGMDAIGKDFGHHKQ